jgi:hypothetical protein
MVDLEPLPAVAVQAACCESLSSPKYKRVF